MTFFGWCNTGQHRDCRSKVGDWLRCDCWCHHRADLTPPEPDPEPAPKPRSRRASAVEPAEPAEPQPVVVKTTAGELQLPPGVTMDDDGTLRMHDEQGRLHNAAGPAVSYTDNTFEHWWHGQRVTAEEHRTLKDQQ